MNTSRKSSEAHCHCDRQQCGEEHHRGIPHIGSLRKKRNEISPLYQSRAKKSGRKEINSPATLDPLVFVGGLPSLGPNPVEPGRIVERVGVSEVEASGKEVAPNPPATAESWANPIDAGEAARKTEYTFFYESCFSLLYLQQI